MQLCKAAFRIAALHLQLSACSLALAAYTVQLVALEAEPSWLQSSFLQLDGEETCILEADF